MASFRTEIIEKDEKIERLTRENELNKEKINKIERELQEINNKYNDTYQLCQRLSQQIEVTFKYE